MLFFFIVAKPILQTIILCNCTNRSARVHPIDQTMTFIVGLN